MVGSYPNGTAETICRGSRLEDLILQLLKAGKVEGKVDVCGPSNFNFIQDYAALYDDIRAPMLRIWKPRDWEKAVLDFYAAKKDNGWQYGTCLLSSAHRSCRLGAVARACIFGETPHIGETFLGDVRNRIPTDEGLACRFGHGEPADGSLSLLPLRVLSVRTPGGAMRRTWRDRRRSSAEKMFDGFPSRKNPGRYLKRSLLPSLAKPFAVDLEGSAPGLVAGCEPFESGRTAKAMSNWKIRRWFWISCGR
jgi:hypothetical protein